MSLAFDKSAVVKEYKNEIDTLQHEKDAIAKKLGETIVEKDFLVEKLKSLALKDILYLFRYKERKSLLDSKHKLS